MSMFLHHVSESMPTIWVNHECLSQKVFWTDLVILFSEGTNKPPIKGVTFSSSVQLTPHAEGRPTLTHPLDSEPVITNRS